MIKFTYLALVFLAIEFIIFLLLVNKKEKNKIRKVITDALTFNSGLVLFLYLFGVIMSIEYFKNTDEFLLLMAYFIAGIYLMSIADEYYKNLKSKIKRWRKKKNGRTQN